MSQPWNQVPQGYQYPMQTGMPFQQQQMVSQQTGYPSLQQQPGQQRPGFATLQPQQTGFPGAPSFQQPQATGFNQFQRPMLTGAPPMGFQNNQPGGIPPVPALPTNLNIPSQQPNRFLSTSPSPSGFSPAGPTSGFQPAASPLVAQPTGFMDPRLTMMGSTFMPTAGGNFPMGGAAQYNGGTTLQQSIAQHNQDKRGTTQQRIPWALSKQERKQYDQIFRAWDATGSGFLDGQKALEVFGASGLDKNDLVKIWSLADPDDRGKLNREEFHVAMGLIYRRLNGNDIPEELPQELVPPSANSLGESVDMLRDLLKNENYARATADSPQTKGKVRSFYGNGGQQDSRKEGANYKHNDDEDVPIHRSTSRYVDRKAVRAGTESPSADLAEMQRQLENAAKRIDKVTAEQAARSMEDEDLEREMDELRRRVKRVQDDLEYVSRGPRSFEKDEDRRKLERELLNLLHERLPEVQRKMDDRERRKKRERDDWSSDRDKRNATFGRYGQLDRDRGGDRDRDDYRRYDDRREEDRGYMKGTFDRSRDGSRERSREDRYKDDRYSDRERDSPRDRYDRNDRDRPRSPPQRTRTPPPAPAPAVVEKARPPPPAPSPSVMSTKNMTAEERQAFIRAEAARRLEERQQRLGLIAPSVTPAPDTALEERLAREKAEATEKANAAEKEAEQREATRQARLASDRGDAPKPASPAPTPAAVRTPAYVPSPVTPSSPPASGRKKAPPPPAPRPRGAAPPPSAMKKAAVPPPPKPVGNLPTPAPGPPVVAPAPPPAPEVDPEEEAFRAREAKLRQAREERAARMRELERMEEEARLEEQRFQERRAAYASRSATSTPVPTAAASTPAPPPPPPAPIVPVAAAASTNPFHRMQQGVGAPATSPPTNTSSGFNPFARPAVSSTVPPAPVSTQVAPPNPPPPPPPPAPIQQLEAVQPPAPVIHSPVPGPVQPAPVSRPPPASSKKPTYDDDESWDSPHEKDDDDDDSSDDDRTARQKLARHLFGTIAPASPRPESRGSNIRSATQTPAPPPPPVAPVSVPTVSAPESAYVSAPTAPVPPAPPPPSATAIPPVGGSTGRGALLQSIVGGARLKPTKTVDRSVVSGAGAVLGDAAPPEHIIQPKRSSPSPPPQETAAPVSNGHTYKESVDWYADLAADAAPPAPPPPPPLPVLSSVTEEEPTRNYSAVPAINIQAEEPVASEPDPLDDVDMQTSQRVRSLYPYEGSRDEDLSFAENTVIIAHPSKTGGPWWYGLLPSTGKKGFFPHTYVQDMEEVQAVALYSYEGANPDEFSFQEGDRITIVDRSEEDWWKTEQRNQILIVPAAYLQLASVLDLPDGSTDAQASPRAPSLSINGDHAESNWNSDGSNESDDSSEDEFMTSSESEDEAPQTDAQRQEERQQRELERQKVLEAAGLIVKQSTEKRPPRPPVRTRSSRRSTSNKEDLVLPKESHESKAHHDRELPSLPPLSPPNDGRNLDDAFERYEAFKQQEASTNATNLANRQSVISNASTYASTVPPSSPRQPVSPGPLSATLPSSASVHSTESKISSLLHFLGGRTRTPGESSSTTTERKVISGPIALSSPSRENSPAFGSSWSSLVNKEALKEIPPHERKRQEAIFELINTEGSYVRDLQLIVEVFYANMLSLLDEKAITVIFANVEDLLLTNTAFLSQLEERQKECRLYIDNIGDLLEKHIGAMGVYMQYCVNQSNAIKILQSLRDTKPELAAKLHHLRETEAAVRSLDLSSYLLSPMQRITRYPLLIRQILQYTQHGHDRGLIETALLAAESVLEAINESIRDQEGNDRLKELSKTLWVGNGQLDLTAPTRFMGPRKLIKEGIVTKAKSRRRIRVILCSDILVLVGESTGAVYRIPIPLSSATVHEASGARDDISFAISTSYPRGGTQMGLRAGSPRECQLWIKAIQEAQLQCVAAENQHLKRQSRAMRTSMG